MGRKKNQLYEVEIRSMALIREGRKSFICYFQGGNHKTIIKNAMAKYPQFTNPKDKPNIDITPITYREYEERLGKDVIHKKGRMLEGRGHIDEIMGT